MYHKRFCGVFFQEGLRIRECICKITEIVHLNGIRWSFQFTFFQFLLIIFPLRIDNSWQGMIRATSLYSAVILSTVLYYTSNYR